MPLLSSSSPPSSECTSCSRSLSFLMASSSTTVDYESCRLRSVSPHFKTPPSGRVKGYGTPVQHQSNLCRVWDELSVFVDISYVRFVSLCCNYCTDNTPEILLICQGLVDAKALGGNDGTRWLILLLGFLIFWLFHLFRFCVDTLQTPDSSALK